MDTRKPVQPGEDVEGETNISEPLTEGHSDARMTEARDSQTPLLRLRELSDDEECVRIALAERRELPGPLESKLVRDESAEVLKALVMNPHSSNYCIGQAPRWITWENNGRIYDQRNLPHHFWDMLLLYLFGTGAMALPLFTIMFHIIFEGAVTPYLWPYAVLMVVVFGLLYLRRVRNYPKPKGWGDWD